MDYMDDNYIIYRWNIYNIYLLANFLLLNLFKIFLIYEKWLAYDVSTVLLTIRVSRIIVLGVRSLRIIAMGTPTMDIYKYSLWNVIMCHWFQSIWHKYK